MAPLGLGLLSRCVQGCRLIERFVFTWCAGQGDSERWWFLYGYRPVFVFSANCPVQVGELPSQVKCSGGGGVGGG